MSRMILQTATFEDESPPATEGEEGRFAFFSLSLCVFDSVCEPLLREQFCLIPSGYVLNVHPSVPFM